VERIRSEDLIRRLAVSREDKVTVITGVSLGIVLGLALAAGGAQERLRPPSRLAPAALPLLACGQRARSGGKRYAVLVVSRSMTPEIADVEVH